jgi:hypothetical protein
MDDQEFNCRELAGSSDTMTNDDKEGWYHCGHCGSLFRSNYGFDESRLCASCQCKPVVGFGRVMNSNGPVGSAKVAGSHKPVDKPHETGATRPTGKRAVRIVFLVVIIWILVLLAVVALKFYLTSSPAGKPDPALADPGGVLPFAFIGDFFPTTF